MKKLTLILFLLPLIGFSQKSDSTAANFNFYMGASMSVSNGDTIENVSYPSIEGGICYENLTFGVNVGRSNMSFDSKDFISNYYWELKSTVSTKVGIVKGYLMFGYGHYFDTRHNLLEFGGGIVHSMGKTDLSLQFSNFDTKDYISIGIARNF